MLETFNAISMFENIFSRSRTAFKIIWFPYLCLRHDELSVIVNTNSNKHLNDWTESLCLSCVIIHGTLTLSETVSLHDDFIQFSFWKNDLMQDDDGAASSQKQSYYWAAYGF